MNGWEDRDDCTVVDVGLLASLLASLPFAEQSAVCSASRCMNVLLCRRRSIKATCRAHAGAKRVHRLCHGRSSCGTGQHGRGPVAQLGGHGCWRRGYLG